MIICKTPLRISFFGGGTDFPDWYNKNGGAVISTTINKYCYSTLRTLPPFFNFKFRLRYFKTELESNIKKINHPTIREVLKRYHSNNDKGLEITHYADVPGLSGLGGSSAFTVSLLNLVNSYNENKISKKKLAELAINLEQNILKEKVGSQDQVACSFGGLNMIKFKKSRIDVRKIKINTNIQNFLENNLTIVYSGFPRKAHYIEKDKIKLLNTKEEYYYQMKNITKEASKLFSYNDTSKFIKEFAFLLNESWKLKKNFSSKVTNSKINNLFETCLSNGAIAGKILGAGGGGFCLFLSKNNNDKNKLIRNIKKNVFMNIKFENTGSKIIYKYMDIYK